MQLASSRSGASSALVAGAPRYAKRSLPELTALVKTRLKKMQYRLSLLDGFLASTKLNCTPLCNPHS